MFPILILFLLQIQLWEQVVSGEKFISLVKYILSGIK